MITGIGVAASLSKAIADGLANDHEKTRADESLRRWRAQVMQSLVVLSERQQAVDALPQGDHTDNLALLLVPAGPSPGRPEKFVKGFAVASCVHWINKPDCFGQRVFLDDQFGAIFRWFAGCPTRNLPTPQLYTQTWVSA